MLYEFDHQQLDQFTAPAPRTALSPDEPTNEELMARIQQRDESALANLCRRHRMLLRTIVARIVHADHDVDDVLQDVSIELWNRADGYDEGKGKVLGWIITLARRRAIDRVRRHQAYSRAGERLRLETECEGDQTFQPGADVDAAAADRAELLKNILATLPEGQREALHLAFYCGLSQREIAAKTGIPLGTIKTRLELGVRKVKTAVLSMGGEEVWSLTHA